MPEIKSYQKFIEHLKEDEIIDFKNPLYLDCILSPIF